MMLRKGCMTVFPRYYFKSEKAVANALGEYHDWYDIVFKDIQKYPITFTRDVDGNLHAFDKDCTEDDWARRYKFVPYFQVVNKQTLGEL